jgi:hypothetical protein
MAYETILYSVTGPVAEIRFNRPHRLNAVVSEYYAEVIDALNKAEDDRQRFGQRHRCSHAPDQFRPIGTLRNRDRRG